MAMHPRRIKYAYQSELGVQCWGQKIQCSYQILVGKGIRIKYEGHGLKK